MQTNKPNTLIKTIGWIKANKIKSSLILLSFVSILYIVLPHSKKPVQDKIEIKPSSSPFVETNYSYDQNQIPKYNVKNEPYLLNRFDTVSSVNGYGWNNNLIVYSSKNGIYELFENKLIYKMSIEDSLFSKDSSKTIIKNTEGYFLLNLTSLQSENLNIFSKVLKADNNLNFVIYKENSALKLMNTLNKKVTEIITEESEHEFDWIHNRNKFYISYPKLYNLEVFDSEGQKLNTIKINNGTNFLSISPDLNRIITTDSEFFYINDSQGNIVFSTKFNNNIDIKLYWISENEFIVMEKEYLSDLGIYDQYLWILNLDGNKLYFSNSIPVVTKINEKRKLLVNENKTAILSQDNEGSIWVFSLKPALIPTYTEEGVFLYKVPETSREDSH